MKLSRFVGQVLGLALTASVGQTQTWDLPARGAAWLSRQTGNKLTVSGEIRGRYERRTSQAFGGEPDLTAALFRNRFSMCYRPAPWLKFSGAVQDSRAPSRGLNAPSSIRNQADWLEGYVELLPERKQGFGMTVGRMLLSYGETRLIASSQWGNVTRSFDQARIYWRSTKGRLELLWASPVKARLGAFDRPALGERVWGAYNSFPNLFGKNLAEVYALRHDNNIAGTVRLGVNTLGGRLAGPLPRGLQYSLETALQTGKQGGTSRRGAAWFSSLSRRWMAAGLPLDVTGEYKFSSHAFDPLFPSTHDKFGHMDLFAWRNIHDVRGQATLGVTQSLAVNLMYNSWWLASARDALYGASGKPIARSPGGAAGSHVGQEMDVFATYKYQRFTFGAGFGRMFKGRFIQTATPGVEPAYFYVFHTYSL